MQRDLEEQEEHLQITRGQYHQLQDQLQDMLATVAREAEQIGRLESELREGILRLYFMNFRIKMVSFRGSGC